MTVRAWRRPQARVGGVYRLSPRGVIVVDALDGVAIDDLTDRDAADCGFANRAELLGQLGAASAGRRTVEPLTRLRFHYEARLDERVELRDDHLDGEALAARLAAMDVRSKHGAWTLDTLRAIEASPLVVSTRLAAALGRETRPFKADVRKLKKLGLTISHEVGYALSPRGRVLASWFLRARPSSRAARIRRGRCDPRRGKARDRRSGSRM